MKQAEHYLLSNLVGLASGQTKGRFQLDSHHSSMMLELYESPPMYVEFSGPKKLAKRLARFMEREDRVPFCRTLLTFLCRAARGKIMFAVGAKGALGLIACLDKDLQRECGLNG